MLNGAGEEWKILYIYVRNESERPWHEKEDANLVWTRKHKNVSKNEGNIIPETLVTWRKIEWTDREGITDDQNLKTKDEKRAIYRTREENCIIELCNFVMRE